MQKEDERDMVEMVSSATTKLYSENADDLRNHFRWRYPNPVYWDIIDDAVDDTFMVFFLRYEELKDHPNIKAWLRKTCDHKVKDGYRKVYEDITKNDPLDVADNLPDVNFEHPFYAQMTRTEVREYLPKLLAYVVIEHVLDGMTVKEIANKLEVSENIVKDMLRQALAKLEKVRKAQYGEEDERDGHKNIHDK